MKLLEKIIKLLLEIFVSKKQNYEKDFHEPDEIIKSTSITIVSPVENEIPIITRNGKYGMRKLPGGKWQLHKGIDLRARHNSFAYACEDCEIIGTRDINENAPCRFIYSNGRYIDLHNGSITPKVVLLGLHTGNKYIYYHCRPANLNSKILEAGDVVGNFGNYGYSMGSHAHIEVLIKNKNVNPKKYFNKMGLFIK